MPKTATCLEWPWCPHQPAVQGDLEGSCEDETREHTEDMTRASHLLLPWEASAPFPHGFACSSVAGLACKQTLAFHLRVFPENSPLLSGLKCLAFWKIYNSAV